MRHTIVFLAVVFLASGCMLNPEVFGYGDGAKRLADGYFVIEMPPDTVNRAGGPSSQETKNLIDQKVVQKGLCKGGYEIVSQGVGRGYFYFQGKCQ